MHKNSCIKTVVSICYFDQWLCRRRSEAEHGYLSVPLPKFCRKTAEPHSHMSKYALPALAPCLMFTVDRNERIAIVSY